MKLIQQVDLTTLDETSFVYRCVSCIILTFDNKILLQQRGNNWPSFPGFISTFGGQIAPDEMPIHALIRELNEELGAVVEESEVISFGAYTESVSNHKELIYGYFWHDKHDTITGCYEGDAKYYVNINDILLASKIMDDVRWLINECLNQHLIKGSLK